MGKLNPWLEEKLKKIGSPKTISLIVECETPAIESVKSQLKGITTISIGRQAFNMIEVSAPLEAVSKIEAMPGVVMVHYNMPKRILALPSRLTSIIDPLIGEIMIDNIVCPRERLSLDMLLPFSFFRFLHGPLGEIKIIPTNQSREVILDVPTTLTGQGVTLAILDTGGAPQNLQTLGITSYSVCSTDPFPLDMHGHGSWCASAAGGKAASGILGKVLGVAPEANLISIKVLHGIFGFGTSMDIIKGIEKAVNSDAKVISMSLGGEECEGGCTNCPECKIINELSTKGIIFCIAAGNSGPAEWTIGCPACAEGAITVGSVSMMDYPEPAYFSSRGPQNKANPVTMDIKPDILAPGGGRAVATVTPDEVIYAGEEGWMKGVYCLTPETRVMTTKGIEYITNIKKNDYVYSVNGNRCFEPHRVEDLIYRGYKPIFEIRLRGSWGIRTTETHPFLSAVGEKYNPKVHCRGNHSWSLAWKQVKDLHIGDVVAIPKQLPSEGILPPIPNVIQGRKSRRPIRVPSKITEDLMWLLGFWLGDGTKRERGANGGEVYFCVVESDLARESVVKSIVQIFGVSPGLHKSCVSIGSGQLCRLLSALGFNGNWNTKRIPKWVFAAPQKYMLALLSGLLDSDGGSGCAGSLVITSASKELLKDAMLLAQSCGVICSLKGRKGRQTQWKSGRVSFSTEYYLKIAKRSRGLFQCKRINCQADSVERNTRGESRKYRGQNMNDLRLVPITGIKYIGESDVYDLSIEGSHNFIANGIIVHNSGIKLDIADCFHGTSQATPAVAGLCAILVQKGYNSASEIKSVMAAKGHAKNPEDGWGVVKLSWFL